MRLSVHIVSCGRLNLLQDCISSVQRALQADSEVVLIVNGACRKTIEYLESLGDVRFRWIEVERESLSRARNRAFVLCRGEIIYFLDDDVVVPPHLFARTLNYFQLNPDLALSGGPNLTPPESTWKEKVFGGVMGSYFAAPMVSARYSCGNGIKTNANEHHFIFCNLAFRSNAIPLGVRFREEFISNQENLFIYLCRKMGLECSMNPEFYVFHKRRKSLKSFLTQVTSYGYGRFQQTAVSPKSSHPLFFVPALCVLVFVSLCIAQKWQIIFWLMSLHSIGSIVGSMGSTELKKAGCSAVFCGAMLTGPLHLFYALGWWRGLIDYFRTANSTERAVFGHQQSFSVPSSLSYTAINAPTKS